MPEEAKLESLELESVGKPLEDIAIEEQVNDELLSALLEELGINRNYLTELNKAYKLFKSQLKPTDKLVMSVEARLLGTTCNHSYSIELYLMEFNPTLNKHQRSVTRFAITKSWESKEESYSYPWGTNLYEPTKDMCEKIKFS